MLSISQFGYHEVDFNDRLYFPKIVLFPFYHFSVYQINLSCLTVLSCAISGTCNTFVRAFPALWFAYSYLLAWRWPFIYIKNGKQQGKLLQLHQDPRLKLLNLQNLQNCANTETIS